MRHIDRAPHRLPALVGIVLTVLVGGCRKSLPAGPSEVTEGLVIYQHANRSGASAHVVADIPDLEKFNGPCDKTETTTLSDGRQITTVISSWDNCISSLRIAPGWRAILYGDDDYKGGRLEVTADVADLKTAVGSCGEGFNDCASSIRVFRP